jgi:hypothetical protein
MGKVDDKSPVTFEEGFCIQGLYPDICEGTSTFRMEVFPQKRFV